MTERPSSKLLKQLEAMGQRQAPAHLARKYQSNSQSTASSVHRQPRGMANNPTFEPAGPGPGAKNDHEAGPSGFNSSARTSDGPAGNQSLDAGYESPDAGYRSPPGEEFMSPNPLYAPPSVSAAGGAEGDGVVQEGPVGEAIDVGEIAVAVAGWESAQQRAPAAAGPGWLKSMFGRGTEPEHPKHAQPESESPATMAQRNIVHSVRAAATWGFVHRYDMLNSGLLERKWNERSKSVKNVDVRAIVKDMTQV